MSLSFFATDNLQDPVALAQGGTKAWRVVASIDDDGRLLGDFWVRGPGQIVLQGHLNHYRMLQPHVPRDMYIALRQFKSTYMAEQAGLGGRA